MKVAGIVSQGVRTVAKWNALDPNATHKVCTKCKEDKLMDEYHNNSKSADGKQSRCKACISEPPERTLEGQLAYRDSKYPTGEKRCSREGVLHPLSEFYVNRASMDGLQAHCKECAKKTTKEYDQANPDKVKERAHKWYEANREKHYANTLRWKRENPEKHAEYVKRSREGRTNT